MNKKILMTLGIVMLFAALVSATAISLSKTTAVTFEQKQARVLNIEIISFDCDGSPHLVNGTEADGNWDANDVESAVRGNCSGSITNIVKGGLTYKENKYGFKSFDEVELNSHECGKDGNNWTGVECLKPVAEVGQMEL